MNWLKTNIIHKQQEKARRIDLCIFVSRERIAVVMQDHTVKRRLLSGHVYQDLIYCNHKQIQQAPLQLT